MSYLGRSGSTVTLLHDTVIKVADYREPCFMAEHPDVFVTIQKIEHHPDGFSDKVIYTMPRLHEPDVHHDLKDALNGGVKRLKRLWNIIANHKVDWRQQLLAHLEVVVLQHELKINTQKLYEIVQRLPEIDRPRLIHGDPTLANIVYCASMNSVERGWLWIDPLERAYIPNDPHVDLGKLFQSCFEYELVLLGNNNPTFHNVLSFELADRADLDWQFGMLWCMVHIVRLLPYQEPRVRMIFERVFNDVQV